MIAIFGFSPLKFISLRAAVTILNNWSVSAYLHIGFQCISIVSLHDGVKGFVQVNRLTLIPAFTEILAGQELLDCEIGCQLDDFVKA